MQRYTSRISFRDISKNSMLAGATLNGKLRTRWLARGNLLVDGGGEPGEFAELPEGGNELISIKLNATIADPEGVAWDGKYFAICDQEQKPNVIDDVSLSGSSDTLMRTVTLDDSVDLLEITISPFGYAKRAFTGPKEIIAADINNDARKGYVWYWTYPKGGAPAVSSGQ